MKDRLLSTIGICRKAGKLVMGFDAVAEAIKLGEISLIVLARDLSPKSAKEMAYLAGKQNISLCKPPISMDEFWSRLGRRCGILGVADKGLADTIIRTASRVNEEE